MHLLVAEAPPLPPPAWEALAAFTILCVLFVAWGMAHLTDAICRAFFGTATGIVGKIPWLGGKLTGPIYAVEKRLTSFLQTAIAALDHQMGVWWHRTARLVDDLGNRIWHAARILARHAQLISLLLGLWPLYKAVRFAIIGLAKLVHAGKQEIGALEKRLHGTTTIITREIPAKVKAIAAPVEHVFPRALAWDRAKLRELERGIDRLERLEHRLARRLSLGVFTGLMVAALARLGLQWVLCHNWRKAGRAVCRMPSGALDDLLGLVTDFLVFDNICTILPYVESAASAVGGPLVSALTDVGAGLCSGNAVADPLHPPQLSLPTTFALAPLGE